MGEYERFVATLINAFIGPVTSRYLRGAGPCTRELGFPGEVHIMQCPGGVVPPRRRRPPDLHDRLRAGRRAHRRRARSATRAPGTSSPPTWAARRSTSASSTTARRSPPTSTLLEQVPRTAPADARRDSIGAGGGSIIWARSRGGSLRVGPRERGRLPGPACYDRGGTEPTVTDADVVLGYIAPDHLRHERVRAPAQPRAGREGDQGAHRRPLGLSLTDAALGIVEVANAKMANALENEIIGRASTRATSC